MSGQSRSVCLWLSMTFSKSVLMTLHGNYLFPSISIVPFVFFLGLVSMFSVPYYYHRSNLRPRTAYLGLRPDVHILGIRNVASRSMSRRPKPMILST